MHRRETRSSRLVRRLRPAGRLLDRAGRGVGPVVLDLAGCACFTAAAWVVALPFGLAVAGLACVVLNWRLRG